MSIKFINSSIHSIHLGHVEIHILALSYLNFNVRILVQGYGVDIVSLSAYVKT